MPEHLEFYLDRAGHNTDLYYKLGTIAARSHRDLDHRHHPTLEIMSKGIPEYLLYKKRERSLGIGDNKTPILYSRFNFAIIAIRLGSMLLSSRSGVSIYHGQIGP